MTDLTKEWGQKQNQKEKNESRDRKTNKNHQ